MGSERTPAGQIRITPVRVRVFLGLALAVLALTSAYHSSQPAGTLRRVIGVSVQVLTGVGGPVPGASSQWQRRLLGQGRPLRGVCPRAARRLGAWVQGRERLPAGGERRPPPHDRAACRGQARPPTGRPGPDGKAAPAAAARGRGQDREPAVRRGWRALVTRRWSYLNWGGAGGRELYDLRSDPAQLEAIHGEPAMKRELQRWIRQLANR